MELAFDLVLLGLPVVAGFGWWRLFPGMIPINRTLLASFWTFVQLSGGLAILGWIGWLNPAVAVLTQVAMTVVVWVFALRMPKLETPPTDEPTPSPDRWALIAVGVIAGLILIRTLGYALVLPIDGSDGASYHLPSVIEALDNGDFRPDASTLTLAQAGPRSVDMLYLWLILGRGLDLVLFGQLLTLPIAVAAVASLAKMARIRDRLAWAAGLSVLFIPVVIAQLTVAYVDVGSGALLLAAVALTLLHLRDDLPRPWGVISALAAIGFAAGAKYSLVLPAALLFLWLLGFDGWRRRLAWAHLAGVVVFLLGVGWYISALVEFGNPTYPVEPPVLQGLFAESEWSVEEVVALELDYTPRLKETPAPLRPLLAWSEPGTGFYIYSYDSRLAGLGPLWPVIWAPAIGIWLIAALIRRSWRLPLLLGVIFLGFFAIQTYPWWTRFTWWLTALGMVAAAWVWQEGPSWLRRGIGVLYLGGALFVLLFTSVQGFWTADRVTALLEGEDQIVQDAGPALAAAYRTDGETIAVPGLAWGSWNTYLRGADFENEVVVVPAGTTKELVEGLIQSGATMAFQPADGPWWPLDALYGSDCVEEVEHDGVREQILFRVTCSA
jgi:hypothetical protein